VIKHPPNNWHVKLCDFGLSKRAGILNTMTKTVRGTDGFIPPDMLADDGWGWKPPDDWRETDMWNLGETVFQMLTGQATFKRRELVAYKSGSIPFPSSELQALHVSREAIDFIESIMKADPKERLTAPQASKHRWMEAFRSQQTNGEDSYPLPPTGRNQDSFMVDWNTKWGQDTDSAVSGVWSAVSGAQGRLSEANEPSMPFAKAFAASPMQQLASEMGNERERRPAETKTQPGSPPPIEPEPVPNLEMQRPDLVNHVRDPVPVPGRDAQMVPLGPSGGAPRTNPGSRRDIMVLGNQTKRQRDRDRRIRRIANE
jgi:hypothetical protein